MWRVETIPGITGWGGLVARRQAQGGTMIWLDACEGHGHGDKGEWSWLMGNDGPGWEGLMVSADAQHMEHVQSDGCRPIDGATVSQRLTISDRGTPPVDAPFLGGWVGWVGYGFRWPIAPPTVATGDWPLLYMIRPSRWVGLHHPTQRVIAVGWGHTDAEWSQWVAGLQADLAAPSPPCRPLNRVQGRFQLPRDAYQTAIQTIQAAIADGHCYQVCLTNEWVAPQGEGSAFDWYGHMRTHNPTGLGAYCQTPYGDIASTSPESLVHMTRQGRIASHPIKGTRSRHAGHSPLTLTENPKERAENVMIVDLIRNDLARVCQPGSVTVDRLWDVETHATLYQLVSTVSGQRRPDQGVWDVLGSLIPGGSMTGAPKAAAMAIIDRLEQRARGVYAGGLGWVGEDGSAQLSMVIRTAVFRDGVVRLGVGGGITSGSWPPSEWEEVLLKARATLPSFCQLDGPPAG